MRTEQGAAQDTASETAELPGFVAPPGFVAMPLRDGFVSPNGPLFVATEPDLRFGFRVGPGQCNPMRICHGGWIATVLDVMLPNIARLTLDDIDGRAMLTVNLSVDYLGTAPLGCWVEGHGQVLRRTGRMVFVQGMLASETGPVARGSGIFRLGPEGSAVRRSSNEE